MVSFATQKHFSSIRSHSLTVGLSTGATGVLLRKCFPVPMSSGLSPTFSSARFRWLGLILRSLIHLELRVEWEEGKDFVWLVPSVKMLSFLNYWPLCQKSDGWRSRAGVRVLNAVALNNVSVCAGAALLLLLKLCSTTRKLGWCHLQQVFVLVLLFRIVLATLDRLCFHGKFKIIISVL